MIHKYWILLFDGNNWISYAGEDTLEDARATAKSAKRFGVTTRIALLLEEDTE